jgi:hypothetical protein
MTYDGHPYEAAGNRQTRKLADRQRLKRLGAPDLSSWLAAARPSPTTVPELTSMAIVRWSRQIKTALHRAE